jgi:hypothetical protein
LLDEFYEASRIEGKPPGATAKRTFITTTLERVTPMRLCGWTRGCWRQRRTLAEPGLHHYGSPP